MLCSLYLFFIRMSVLSSVRHLWILRGTGWKVLLVSSFLVCLSTQIRSGGLPSAIIYDSWFPKWVHGGSTTNFPWKNPWTRILKLIHPLVEGPPDWKRHFNSLLKSNGASPGRVVRTSDTHGIGLILFLSFASGLRSYWQLHASRQPTVVISTSFGPWVSCVFLAYCPWQAELR